MSDPLPHRRLPLLSMRRHVRKAGRIYWSGYLGLTKVLAFEREERRDDVPVGDLDLYVVPTSRSERRRLDGLDAHRRREDSQEKENKNET